jgi:hypothetical protein
VLKFKQHNMKFYITFTLIIIVSQTMSAQEYISEGKNRLNFAKTYLELGGQFSPTFIGKKVLPDGSIMDFENSSAMAPYLNIGGFHFWGHADFFISIPLAQIPFKKNDSTNFTFNKSVVTGARFLPWAFRENKIRPYVGVNWAIINFQNKIKPEENQPLLSENKLIFDAGLLYGKSNLMVRLGVSYDPINTEINYPVTKSSFQKINTPNWNAYFSLIYAFETTRSKKIERINQELIKYPTLSSPTLNVEKKGDWFVGIGPSTSFMLSNSEYNESAFPYFNKKPISNLFFDVTLGYQFNHLGLITAFSYRNPTFSNEAFGTKQMIQKQSVVFEVFKFLTDYSGFTPYIGLNLAVNKIDYFETSNSHNFSQKQALITPGLTFGWDILPGKTEQPFVLRTNLRWFPFEKIKVKDKNFSLNQIEYDVIQLVYYPSRSKRLKNKYAN